MLTMEEALEQGSKLVTQGEIVKGIIIEIRPKEVLVDIGYKSEGIIPNTVFLDEIGEIDKSFQANLLRFLQEREIRPLGASRAKEVDVRVICATNQDLQRLVDEGKFREDLWYRLNTVRIVMPPLRERSDDIPLLARFYVNKYNGLYTREVKLMDSGVHALQDYTWPGNVRQLQHVIERLTILAGRVDRETVFEALTSMESREKPVDTLAD